MHYRFDICSEKRLRWERSGVYYCTFGAVEREDACRRYYNYCKLRSSNATICFSNQPSVCIQCFDLLGLPDPNSFLPCSEFRSPQNLNLLLHRLHPHFLHPATIRTPLIVPVYDRTVRDVIIRSDGAEGSDFTVLTHQSQFSLLL